MTEQRSINGPLKIVSNHYLVLPVGTTSDRNAITAPTRGMLRYSSTTEKLEFYNAPKNKWGNFVDEDLLYSELDKKVNKAGDSMTGDLNMDANIRPLADDRYDLGSTTLRWKNIYGKTLYIDEIKNPNGGKSIFEGDLKGNADTASTWQTPRKLTLTGDSSGDVTFDGSSDFSLNVTNTVATRWRDPSQITIESADGDIDSVDNSFDGQNNTDMHFDIKVNQATKWRNPVNISASGNVKLANTSDPWGVDPNIPSITVPIQGDDGFINLPFVITSVPDSILRNNYVWKHGDTMDGPLTMDNAAIYSEWDQDLVITSRANLALTAAYGGGIDMQSDDDIDLLTPAIIRLRSNHVWQVGNGAFQMARGYTSDRPDDMYTDIGMIRLNRDLHSQVTHPLVGGYMNGGRIEFFNESKYVDPTKLTPGMDPFNSDLDKSTGWTALVSDDDLRDSPIVKELVARMISDIVYNTVGSIDLQMMAKDTAGTPVTFPQSEKNYPNWFQERDPASYPKMGDVGLRQDVPGVPNGIDDDDNKVWLYGGYNLQNNDLNDPAFTYSRAGGAGPVYWPADASEPDPTLWVNKHVASHLQFIINPAKKAGIPDEKIGDYKHSAVTCLFKISESNFWDYIGGHVKLTYSVELQPIGTTGSYLASIQLFAFKDYHAANLGATWFYTAKKFQNW